MSERHQRQFARVVNFFVPGAGLIVLGAETAGVIIALLFAAAATYALAVNLLIPAEFSAMWRNLWFGVALGTWVGAQVRLGQTLKHQRVAARLAVRRSLLRETQVALQEGRLDDAWEAIARLADESPNDLMVAYRLAQVLTARGETAAATHAWERVWRLDKHHVYRSELEAVRRELDAITRDNDARDADTSAEA